MKILSLLGSTGSIGRQVLKLVEAFPDHFRVVGLSAGRNIKRLREQILLFKPRTVSVATAKEIEELAREGFPGYPLDVYCGEEGHEKVATLEEAEIVVSAMIGAVGLRPTLAAIRAKKTVALANKEPLVMAGALMMEECRKYGTTLLPVDSEHSAIFQVLQGQDRTSLRRLILTASGGPFWNYTRSEMAGITDLQALNHPKWKMGPKITIDSATLMNKGLEVMEAHWLFGVPLDKIEILIHPQSIVHSMVEFHDGSLLAQMGWPDMALPIAYALSYPGRLPLTQPSLDLTACSGLTFFPPDLDRFPCLRLALEAARIGGTMPAVLNGVNEMAVSFFLKNMIKYQDIPALIAEIMEQHHGRIPAGLDEIMAVDAWARQSA
ncbi:MAG TPA: 1-deoxy-D-xylulose-5-phosphate reductoisomerase, partial [Thermodesulfobacteriota bacterium]|nr:1-deoxy-D-xylulose-5-phosphate reductoisomerase [Thermodesulfobacteriota bacterium]